MADLKLKSIYIRNWMKFNEITLNFPETGLILVQGVNSASKGALLSVGSGKTGLGEAINRTLLGVPGRFAHLRQFSTHKKGNTYVRLEAEYKGKPLIVETGYKCKEINPSSEGLRYTYDNVQIERETIAKTRENLNNLLGISPLLAEWTVFVDGDRLKFNKLSQAESVELVMASLKQPPWNQYYEASKNTLGKFKRSLAITENNYQTAQFNYEKAKTNYDQAKQNYLQEQKNYEELKEQYQQKIQHLAENIELKKTELSKIKENQAATENKIKTLNNKYEQQTKELETELSSLEQQITNMETKISQQQHVVRSCQQKLTEAKINYDNYNQSGKECPVCKRPWNKIDPVKQTELKNIFIELQDKTTEQQQVLNDYLKKLTELKDKHKTTLQQYKQISNKDQLDALNKELSYITTKHTLILNELHKLEINLQQYSTPPSDTNLKVAKARVEDRKKELEEAKKNLKEISLTLTTDRETLKVLEYWNAAFSPYGIPNMILKESITPLNHDAKRISNALTGNTIEIKYSTVREMASGQEKAQLNIEVNNKLGDQDIAGSSKGEAGLTNFIIAETLAEVGQVAKRIGYRWYDEIVPHQDTKICHSIYSYMRNMVDRLGIIIFLVDHNPVAANYAHKILIVEKKTKNNEIESDIYWA